MYNMNIQEAPILASYHTRERTCKHDNEIIERRLGFGTAAAGRRAEAGAATQIDEVTIDCLSITI